MQNTVPYFYCTIVKDEWNYVGISFIILILWKKSRQIKAVRMQLPAFDKQLHFGITVKRLHFQTSIRATKSLGSYGKKLI